MRRTIPILISISVLGLAACSDDPDTSSFCDDRQQLETSVQGLTDVDLTAGVDGVEAQVEAQLDTIESDLANLRESATEEVRTEIDAVTASVDAVQSAVAESETVAQKIAALQTGLPAVVDSFEALVTAAASIDCE